MQETHWRRPNCQRRESRHKHNSSPGDSAYGWITVGHLGVIDGLLFSLGPDTWRWWLGLILPSSFLIPWESLMYVWVQQMGRKEGPADVRISEHFSWTKDNILERTCLSVPWVSANPGLSRWVWPWCCSWMYVSTLGNIKGLSWNLMMLKAFWQELLSKTPASGRHSSTLQLGQSRLYESFLCWKKKNLWCVNWAWFIYGRNKKPSLPVQKDTVNMSNLRSVFSVSKL